MTGAPERLSRGERQARTKSELVDSARRQFSEHGYARSSLDKIAAEAGYTRGAVYANFGGKAGLFLAVLDERLTEQISDLEAVGTDLDRLGRWRKLNARKQRGLSLAVLEFRIAALRDDRLRLQLATRDRALRRAFAGVITRGAAKLGIELPLPAEQVAVALLALAEGITQQHRLDPSEVDAGTFEVVLEVLIAASSQS